MHRHTYRVYPEGLQVDNMPLTIPGQVQWLKEYMPAYNAEFMQPASAEGDVFITWKGDNLDDILCHQEERTVSADNCVSFEGRKLQIPPDKYRCHYVRARVMVHRHQDGSLAIFHGPRRLADYDGELMNAKIKQAA